jgi:hypothetical protein
MILNNFFSQTNALFKFYLSAKSDAQNVHVSNFDFSKKNGPDCVTNAVFCF